MILYSLLRLLKHILLFHKPQNICNQVKLRLIHSAGLTVVNKEVVPSLFVCFC